MNNQEIFNRVWDHFMPQGNPRSVQAENPQDCQYRGANGARCAAGLFIRDEDYDKRMEGTVVEGLGDKVFKNAGIDVRVSGDLLSDLQSAHDEEQIFRTRYADWVKNPIEFEDRLRKVAATHTLVVPS